MIEPYGVVAVQGIIRNVYNENSREKTVRETINRNLSLIDYTAARHGGPPPGSGARRVGNRSGPDPLRRHPVRALGQAQPAYDDVGLRSAAGVGDRHWSAHTP